MKKASTRSPLKDPPLRLPGQSVEADIEKVREQLLDNLVLLLVVFSFAMMGLLQWWLQTPVQTLVAINFSLLVAASIYAIPRMVGSIKVLKRLKQARDGERAVAEYLDLLREDGCRVLHDLLGDGFNLDHVVIAPQGIYTIETKTISKPISGDAAISYDGERIRIGRFEPERDPITQAKAQATWLKRLVQESTGKSFSVRPVVVFPGWWVEQPKQPAPVWVIEPKMLRSMIQHEPITLTNEEISLVTFHLKRYIRSLPVSS